MPHAPRKARAQFRFCFRSEDGQEEWLLARLCPVYPIWNDTGWRYCVVLRPENAERTRVFVVDNLYFSKGSRMQDAWMSPKEFKRWRWDWFAESFNRTGWKKELKRCWLAPETQPALLIEFDSDGSATLHRSDGEDFDHGEDFDWRFRREWRFGDDENLNFLRRKNVNFQRSARRIWNDADHEIHFARRWAHMDSQERDALAFECEKRIWNFRVGRRKTSCRKSGTGCSNRFANAPRKNRRRCGKFFSKPERFLLDNLAPPY